MPLKVLTYNIQGHAVRKRRDHLERVAETILEIRPDAAGLQEVHRGTTRGGEVDQIAILAERTGMSYAFGRSISGWGGEYGNALLTRGTITSSRAVPLPGRGEPRSVLECHLQMNGYELDMLTTHLAAWFWFLSGARTRQLQALTESMTRRVRPYVLVGDFNASPRSRELVRLARQDVVRACTDACDATHSGTRMQLDYVFSDPGWRTLRQETVKAGPSDHWPLVAELEREEETLP